MFFFSTTTNILQVYFFNKKIESTLTSQEKFKTMFFCHKKVSKMFFYSKKIVGRFFSIYVQILTRIIYLFLD